MKRPSMLERLLPHIIHAAMTATVIVLSVDIIKRLHHLHHDIKVLGEHDGVLKLMEEHHREKKAEEKK